VRRDRWREHRPLHLDLGPLDRVLPVLLLEVLLEVAPTVQGEPKLAATALAIEVASKIYA
jgi:hypothetical protein